MHGCVFIRENVGKPETAAVLKSTTAVSGVVKCILKRSVESFLKILLGASP